MVRALVIRLGEALAPVQRRLEAEFVGRRADELTRVLLQTHDAPVAAVGNLSRPVQLLREQLEAALTQSLTELLTLKPGSGTDFVLDVYILLNLGEPLVANATNVVIEMLARIVDHHFRAIFPRHRQGSARRFRIVPIAILPAARDCEKDRTDAIDELRAVHDAFAAARKLDDREFLVDRVFLLDAMTARGIATRDELVGQVLAFLRLVIFGGVRRHPDVVRLLESDRNDLFASFAVACCEVDYEAVSALLTARMKAALAAALIAEQSADLPRPAELLPVRLLEDPDALEHGIGELEALPGRILQADGAGAIRPLCALYDEVDARLAGWRADGSDPAEVVRDTTAVAVRENSGNSALGIGFLAAVVLGAAVAAAAHFFALASTTVVAASGGGFAVFAFLVTWLLLRGGSDEVDDSAPAVSPRPADQADDTERRAAILDALEHTIDGQRTKLRALREGFDAIARAHEIEPPFDRLDAEATPFRQPLVSPELMRDLYAQHSSVSDARAAVATWLGTCGEWVELLDGHARADAYGLEQFCEARFRTVGSQPLFTKVGARECVAPRLASFVETWRAGLPVFLEGESRVQFDPDGFDQPFSNMLFAPEPLRAELSAQLAEQGSMLRLHATPIAIDDVFAITAMTDIHPDAVSPLADLRERHE